MSLTAADIESGNYTYVRIKCETTESGFCTGRFLVSTPNKDRALQLAIEHITNETLPLRVCPVCQTALCHHNINLYPGKYRSEARILFNLGKFY